MKIKIAILISGKLRYFKENSTFLKNFFKDCIYDVFLSTWESEENILTEFKKNYNPKSVDYIEQKDFSNLISKIKYITPGYAFDERVESIFNQWYAIKCSIENFEKYKENILNYDFICRFRSDLKLFENSIEFIKIKKPKDNEILIPDIYHHGGVNDQFSIGNINTMSKYLKILDYYPQHIENQRLFDPEFINFCYLLEKKIKINFFDLRYTILREKKFHQRTFSNIKYKNFIIKTKLKDKIIKWYLNKSFRIRNFKKIYFDKIIDSNGDKIY